MDLQAVKQRFGIVGNSAILNHALETAIKVAPTEMNVLITGESGVGKESFSKIIHQLSNRKHGPFIAVNCGAIPEGTIDSELFGHEKGAFTGATDKRKGYFETVSGGTIFLDEVGELPLGTQARLLRILESGEYIKVGSSSVMKTNVRVVTATNRDLLERATSGKFREDLYYRLATVPIRVPKLKERKEDIYLMFRKFAGMFAETHHVDIMELDPKAQQLLADFPWPGNVRQLKNITEQICVLEKGPVIGVEVLKKYLPPVYENNLPMLLGSQEDLSSGMSERDIFYKVLIDLKKDVNDLKKIVFTMLENPGMTSDIPRTMNVQTNIQPVNQPVPAVVTDNYNSPEIVIHSRDDEHEYVDATDDSQVDENLTLEHQEIDMIRKALSRNRGRRKRAADDLGISERTLYRKIKLYNLES